MMLEVVFDCIVKKRSCVVSGQCIIGCINNEVVVTHVCEYLRESICPNSVEKILVDIDTRDRSKLFND